MKRRNLFLFGALALSACASRDCCAPVSPPARSPLAKVEPRPYRVIGVVDRCVDVRGKGGRWEATPIFRPKDTKQHLPDSMRRRCAYDWRADSGAPSVVPDYDAVDDPANPRAPDHQVVVTLDDGQTASRMREERRRAFFGEVGGLKPLPPSPPGRVWIGFPDSSPRSDERHEITLGVNPHGFNVAWVARYLTCPDGPGAGTPCVSTPHMEPALDHLTPPVVQDVTSRRGTVGSYGTRSALAQAIFDTVETWKTAPGARGSHSHLVINLSVGWEPDAECPGTRPTDRVLSESSGDGTSGGNEQMIPAKLAPRENEGASRWIRRVTGCTDDSPAEAKQSVFEALVHAACHGALIIAAAGNDPGYRPPLERPVLPAYWENVPMPTRQVCDELFTAPGAASTFSRLDTRGSFLPLLHTVGGVGPGDAPIPTSRTVGIPRLMAPASLAVAYPDEPGQDGYPASCSPARGCSQPLTGTSMATAVASGTAAAVWAYRPELGPHQVMDILYESGQPLPYVETFYREWRHASKRISFCGAINMACPACGVPCDRRPSGAPDEIMRDGVPAKALARPANVLATVSGQPGRPGCPDCVLKLKGPEWVINEGSIINEQFVDGVKAIARPTLRLYSERGVLLGETLLDLMEPGSTTKTLELAIPFGAEPTTRVADVRGKGTIDVAGTVSVATLTWIERLADDRTETVVTEGILISQQ